MRQGAALFALTLAALLLMGGCDDGDSPGGDAGSGSDGGARPDATSTSTTAGVCPVVGYQECGGDLLGTWSFVDLCPEDLAAAAALCEHPYDDQAVCQGPGNEAVCDGRQTGTLTFNEDGTIDIDTQNRLVATWSFTDDCLAAVQAGASPEERCGNLANDRLTCAYENRCICVGDPIVQLDTNTGTYTVAGNEVTIGDDPPATYCIDQGGDLLTMDYYLFHPVSWRYWVLERL